MSPIPAVPLPTTHVPLSSPPLCPVLSPFTYPAADISIHHLVSAFLVPFISSMAFISGLYLTHTEKFVL